MTKTVFLHKIVRNGYSVNGNSRYRFYTNLGNVNMTSDAQFGFTLDYSDPNNSPLVGNWVTLEMRGTTFYSARLA